MTGAGGFLQTLIYGYIGLQITNEEKAYVAFKPTPLAYGPGFDINSIAINNISLLEGEIKISAKLIRPKDFNLKANKNGVCVYFSEAIKGELGKDVWVKIPEEYAFGSSQVKIFDC